MTALPFKIYSSSFTPSRTFCLRDKFVRTSWVLCLLHADASKCTVKTGYPPRSLEIVPELPLASLGLSPSDQIIVVQKEGPSGSLAPSSNSPASALPAPTATSPAVPITSSDSVPVNGSFLIHRVRLLWTFLSTPPCHISYVYQRVPDDNSCLFSSIALIFKQDITKAPEMRKSTSYCQLTLRDLGCPSDTGFSCGGRNKKRSRRI
jgi:hypothetical protein